jgi:hypothetical protein
VKVVVVSTQRLDSNASARDSMRRLVARGDDVRQICLAADDSVEGVTETLALGPAVSGASHGVVGRVLVRIHPGSLARQLTRAVRRSSTARHWLDDADLVIGVQPATAQLLWRQARRRPDIPHIIGLDSALTRTSP